VFTLKRKEKSLLLIGVMIGVLLTFSTNYLISNCGRVIQWSTTLPDTRQMEIVKQSAVIPYIVKTGDTFDGLAEKFYPSVDPRNFRWVVMEKNNLKNANIIAGEIIMIPVEGQK
jgi:hypothetical protein